MESSRAPFKSSENLITLTEEVILLNQIPVKLVLNNGILNSPKKTEKYAGDVCLVVHNSRYISLINMEFDNIDISNDGLVTLTYNGNQSLKVKTPYFEDCQKIKKEHTKYREDLQHELKQVPALKNFPSEILIIISMFFTKPSPLMPPPIPSTIAKKKSNICTLL